eukprot:TRINITY_DN43578_c0_g1_i1.p1 TRINITY_DN43578_c0_g1~~TRINITY_DN43578_c0_g1_i1.p1  ORF type:complete len:400 (+),score=71.92 TRINITY_DN43578_c0_g1_i1:149-1348(+)
MSTPSGSAGTWNSSTQCWLPPEECELYAEAWRTLVSSEDVQSTWNERNEYQRPDWLTRMRIDAALQFDGAQKQLKKYGLGHRPEERLPVLDIPVYMQVGESTSERSAAARKSLAAVLQQFACSKRDLGYNRTIGSLGGIMLAVIGNKKLAFQCLNAVYTRYRLQEYFVVSRFPERGKSASKVDASKVYSMLEEHVPELVQPFIREGCAELLVDQAEHFLRTLLTEVYDRRKQHFAYFVRLIHRVIFPFEEHDDEDPRRQLRAVVFSVFCRHRANFARCSSAKELQDELDELLDFVLVDTPLLKTMNMPLPLPENLYWSGDINLFLGLATASVACDVLGVPEVLDLSVGLASFYPCYLLTESWLHDLAEATTRKAWRLELELELDDETSDNAEHRCAGFP